MATAAVISPSEEQRRALEIFLGALPRFNKIVSYSTIADIKKSITAGPDIVFLSDSLDLEEAAGFVLWLKATKFGKKTTFVGLCRSGDVDTEKLGDLLALGMHGIIHEPFTAEELETVIQVSRGVRTQGTRLRLKTAAALFLANALDKMTSESGLPVDGKDILTKVKDACRDYKRLTGISLTLDVVRPEGKKVSEYHGVSRRVKEIYELRLKSLVGKLFKPSA